MKSDDFCSYFDKIKNKLNCSDVFLRYFIGISIFFLFCCFALLIPFIRNLIIMLGESIANHPFPHNHPVWHETLIKTGITGIVLYFVFFFVFILNDFFSQIITSKKSAVLIVILLLLYIFIIMFRANWSFGDDHEYIRTTAINKYTPSFTESGRFAPLKYMQYNLTLFIFRCFGINTGLPVKVHFAVISFFCIVSVLCLYFLFKETDPFNDNSHSFFDLFFLCSFFLLARSFSTVFLNLIFPETQVIMLFSVFMLMYYKALKTNKAKYYVFALLAAVYSSYCKEPVFGVFLVIAVVNYLFRYKRKSKQEKIFYMTIIANSVVFLLLYYFLSFRNTTGLYNEGRVAISGFRFLLSIFKTNPVLIIMFLFSFIRMYFIIIRRDREHLYYDSLLFAGIAYSFAIILLHLNSGYYFLPSIILFLPSLVYWVKYLYKKKYTLALCLFVVLITIYMYNWNGTIENIKYIYQERQELMPYITNLFSEYNNGKKFIWYESDNKITDNVFYIAVRDWRKFTENAFLNYVSKNQGKEFFIVKNNTDRIDMNQNILFFYPVDNDQYQPMPDGLVKKLRYNNFELYKDSYGILIYRHYLPK